MRINNTKYVKYIYMKNLKCKKKNNRVVKNVEKTYLIYLVYPSFVLNVKIAKIKL